MHSFVWFLLLLVQSVRLRKRRFFKNEFVCPERHESDHVVTCLRATSAPGFQEKFFLVAFRPLWAFCLLKLTPQLPMHTPKFPHPLLPMPCLVLLPRSQDLLLLLGQATFTLPFLTQLKCHLLQNAFLDLVPSGSYSISLLIPQQFLGFSLSQDGSTWRRYGVIPCTRPELNTCNPMPA